MVWMTEGKRGWSLQRVTWESHPHMFPMQTEGEIQRDSWCLSLSCLWTATHAHHTHSLPLHMITHSVGRGKVAWCTYRVGEIVFFCHFHTQWLQKLQLQVWQMSAFSALCAEHWGTVIQDCCSLLSGIWKAKISKLAVDRQTSLPWIFMAAAVSAARCEEKCRTLHCDILG